MASIVQLCHSERSKPKGAKYLSYDASGAVDIMKRKENGSPLLRESGDSAIKVKTALRSTPYFSLARSALSPPVFAAAFFRSFHVWKIPLS